jgi:hypothetical protein
MFWFGDDIPETPPLDDCIASCVPISVQAGAYVPITGAVIGTRGVTAFVTAIGEHCVAAFK